MQLQRITSTADFARLRHEWNALAHGNPFRSWEWLFSWWESYGERDELCVLLVRDDEGQLVGAAPWYLERHPGRGITLRFLGSGEVCTDYLSLLSTYEHLATVASQIAHWLVDTSRQDRQTRWDVLELEGVIAGDPALDRLIVLLTEAGCAVHQQPTINGWRVPLPTSWDEYLKRLSKSKRGQVKDVLHRFFDSGRGRVHEYRTPQEIAAALPVLIDLHQRRRESLGEPGCFASHRFGRFFPVAVERLAATRQAVLVILDLDGLPVAADMNFVAGDAIYAYQGGVAPEALKESPGRALTGSILQQAIERGYQAYDLLRGDEPYKQDWRAEPYALVDLRVSPNESWAQVRHHVWVAGVTVKDWIRESIGWLGTR